MSQQVKEELNTWNWGEEEGLPSQERGVPKAHTFTQAGGLIQIPVFHAQS